MHVTAPFNFAVETIKNPSAPSVMAECGNPRKPERTGYPGTHSRESMSHNLSSIFSHLLNPSCPIIARLCSETVCWYPRIRNAPDTTQEQIRWRSPVADLRLFSAPCSSCMHNDRPPVLERQEEKCLRACESGNTTSRNGPGVLWLHLLPMHWSPHSRRGHCQARTAHGLVEDVEASLTLEDENSGSDWIETPVLMHRRDPAGADR